MSRGGDGRGVGFPAFPRSWFCPLITTNVPEGLWPRKIWGPHPAAWLWPPQLQRDMVSLLPWGIHVPLHHTTGHHSRAWPLPIPGFIVMGWCQSGWQEQGWDFITSHVKFSIGHSCLSAHHQPISQLVPLYLLTPTPLGKGLFPKNWENQVLAASDQC